VKYEEFLDDLLRRTRRRVKMMELGAGWVIFLALLVAFVTLAVILDHTVALPKTARWTVLLTLDAAVALVLILAGVFVLRRLSNLYAARLIEKNYPEFRNTLISYLEARNLSDVPAGIKAFIEEQATERALKVNPDVVISPRRLVVGAYALLLAILVFFFYSLLSPKSVTVALRRLWDPAADIAPATATRIVEVEPGSTAAVIGSDVPVTVSLRGVVPERVTLRWSREQELWERLELTALNEGSRWESVLADVEHDLYYYIEAGDARTQTYHLIVVPTPLVTDLETRYRYPGYSGLPDRVTYRGDVDALDGTTITVRAHTNTTLASAHLVVNDVTVPATVLRPAADEEPGDTVEATFTVSRTGSYQIHLNDPYDFTNPDPPRYEILCRYDQPPAVSILEPRESVRLPVTEPLRIRFKATDDLGLAGLQFRYRIPGRSEEGSEELPLPANPNEVSNEVAVHLDRLGVKPGQSLSCYLQATDTLPDEPHVSRSGTLVVLVPLSEELGEAYAQTEQSQAGPATSEPASPPGPPAQQETEPVPRETGLAPADEEFAERRTEPTLEEMIARDQAIIDTIRQHLDAEAQAEAPPAGPADQRAQDQEQPGTTQAQATQPGQAAPQDAGQQAAGEPGRTNGPAERAGDAASAQTGSADGQDTGAPGGDESGAPSSQNGAGQPASEGGQPGAVAAQPGSDEPGGGHGEAPAPGSGEPGRPAGGEPEDGSGGQAGDAGSVPGVPGGQAAGGEATATADQAGGGSAEEGGQEAGGQGRASASRGEGSGESTSVGGSGEQGGEDQSGQPSAQGGEGQAGQGESGQSAAGRGGSAASPQSQGSGAQSTSPGGQSGDAQGGASTPGVLEPGTGDGSGEGGGGGGGKTGEQAPELQVPPNLETPTAQSEDLKVVGRVIDELSQRLLRNKIDPKLLEALNWDVQDLAAWVVTYKAKLDALPEEKADAGVLLGGGPLDVVQPEERVIEMATTVKPVTPTVGDEAVNMSPDELKGLLQGAKGSLSPEYRQLLEDYYKALSDAAPE